MPQRERIDPYELQADARTWDFFWQQAVATVVVDSILSDIFQGKKDNLRDQMLDVAARNCRRIDWGPAGDIDEKRRAVLLRMADEHLKSRSGEHHGQT